LPRLQPLYEKYRDRGFRVVAVEATHNTDAAKKFIAEKGLTYSFLEDNDNANVVHGLFGVHSFPTAYVIDRDGKIMYYHLGFEPGDEKTISEEIETLL
jgi:cytochrome c biogenesis protein CcmG, thiol:disulfide interchange protein DsbE